MKMKPDSGIKSLSSKERSFNPKNCVKCGGSVSLISDMYFRCDDCGYHYMGKGIKKLVDRAVQQRLEGLRDFVETERGQAVGNMNRLIGTDGSHFYNGYRHACEKVLKAIDSKIPFFQNEQAKNGLLTPKKKLELLLEQETKLMHEMRDERNKAEQRIKTMEHNWCVKMKEIAEKDKEMVRIEADRLNWKEECARLKKENRITIICKHGNVYHEGEKSDHDCHYARFINGHDTGIALCLVMDLNQEIERLKKERDTVTKGLIEDNQKLALDVERLKNELSDYTEGQIEPLVKRQVQQALEGLNDDFGCFKKDWIARGQPKDEIVVNIDWVINRISKATDSLKEKA